MSTKKFHIVHSDDDKFILEVYKKAFEKVGFEVTSLSKLEGDFVTEIANQKPDLVISDMIKPDVSGLELLKALKEDGRTKSVPFVFLSNSINKENGVEAERLGTVEFLTKADVTVEEVVQKIRNFLINK